MYLCRRPSRILGGALFSSQAIVYSVFLSSSVPRGTYSSASVLLLSSIQSFNSASNKALYISNSSAGITELAEVDVGAANTKSLLEDPPISIEPSPTLQSHLGVMTGGSL